MSNSIHNIVSFIYRFVRKIQLRTKKVFIDKGVFLNPKSSFGGWNKIHKGSVVSSTSIGRYSFIGEDCYMPECQIGSFCSIGNNVQIIAETHPTSGFLSTSPVFYSTNLPCGKTFAKEQLFKERLYTFNQNENRVRVNIGSDVWIGSNVTILGGLTIGNGSIIATGAVVTKDVPPYSIVGGVPAKLIRKRFSEERIAELLAEKWWDWTDDMIKKHYPSYFKL